MKKKIKLSTLNLIFMISVFLVSVFTGRLTGEVALLAYINIAGYFSIYLKDWEWDVERFQETVKKSLATFQIKVK